MFIYIDDILIAAKSEQELDRIINQVVERARSLNIKFNENKLQFKVTEVSFLWHVFNEKGVNPDPKRIQAIKEIKAPKTKKELQSIMGMVNYLAL